jgi:hypothetical protein
VTAPDPDPVVTPESLTPPEPKAPIGDPPEDLDTETPKVPEAATETPGPAAAEQASLGVVPTASTSPSALMAVGLVQKRKKKQAEGTSAGGVRA